MRTTEPIQDKEGVGPLGAFLADSLRALGHGGADYRLLPLAGDGSARRFWRVLIPGRETSYVAMQNEPRDLKRDRENRAYLLIGRHLLNRGIPVPEIYRADLSSGLFVMQDLGDENLQEASEKGDRLLLYREVLRVLIRMQVEGSEGFDPRWTCQTERYDRSVMGPYEAEYFEEAFLGRYLGLKSRWPELETSFDFIAEEASRPASGFFLHRDFQSRNIMISGAGIGIIDWQGGRLGPLGYDLASLIIDPYTALSPGEQDEFYRTYVTILRDLEPSWVNPFEDSFHYLAIQRNLQILGAFSHLSKVVGKTYFEAYIPRAVETLQGLLEKVPGKRLAPLRELVATIGEFIH